MERVYRRAKVVGIVAKPWLSPFMVLEIRKKHLNSYHHLTRGPPSAFTRIFDSSPQTRSELVKNVTIHPGSTTIIGAHLTPRTYHIESVGGLRLIAASGRPPPGSSSNVAELPLPRVCVLVLVLPIEEL
jgi:hypothetical protein